MLTLSTVPPELLGWALLSLFCCPLLIPFVMTRARTVPALHRARRRREVRSVATTTDPAVWLGYVDRAGPVVFDVETEPGLSWAAPAPRGLHLTDAEVVAVAAGLDAEWSATPNADDVEGWLADLTRRNHP